MAQLHCLTLRKIFHSTATLFSSANRFSTHRLSTETLDAEREKTNLEATPKTEFNMNTTGSHCPFKYQGFALHGVKGWDT